MEVKLQKPDNAFYWHRRTGKMEKVALYQIGNEWCSGDMSYGVMGLEGTIGDVHAGDLILSPGSQISYEVWPHFNFEYEMGTEVLSKIMYINNDIGLGVCVRPLRW